MSQLAWPLPLTSTGGDPDGLRFHQRDAFNDTMPRLERGERTLVVMATGLGKTELFSAVAKHWTRGDVLVLSHRDELVDQAAKRLGKMTGEPVAIEKAERRSGRERLVSGSVQSMTARRLERMGPRRFGLIIVDEGHHAVADSYRRVLDFFRAPVLGVTATADRGDKRALGAVFQSVAYTMDISDGIDAGLLVPVRGREIKLGEIDLSGVRVSSGDLVQAQMDEIMLRAVEGLVVETLRHAPDRQGVVFLPGVNSASFAADRFNALKPFSAAFVCGDTPPLERRRIMAEFRAGHIQYLTNCDIATEGFDAPGVSLVVHGAPTLSRAKYTQRTGRGTRPLPGTIDCLPSRGQATKRSEAICCSTKPDLLVLDLVGNSGRHSLVGVTDVLGGKYSDAEISLAKERHVERPGQDQRVLLEEARRELGELARRGAARVQSEVRDFDPFVPNAEAQATPAHSRGFTGPSDKQISALKKWGYHDVELVGVSRAQASKLLDEQIERKRAGLASKKQLAVLERYGWKEPAVPFAKASEGLNYLAKAGWSRARISANELERLLK